MATRKASNLVTTTNRRGRSKKASRQVIGTASAEKGAEFENDVAELYRLLGAEVTQNIEIANKKVDLLVTFPVPGSSGTHRVLVECKDEKRRVADNQRVMQFHGLLKTARELGIAESAEIISRVPWSDAAKGYARQSGIGLLTYAEKVSRLIDFSGYLKDLVRTFDVVDDSRPGEPPLGAYYVSSSAEPLLAGKTVHIPMADRYVLESLADDHGKRHIAVLGGYGTGKTSLAKKIARDLADAYLTSPGSVRIPILLALRDFTGKVDLEALVTSFLDRHCRAPNPRFALFDAMNSAGKFLLILDGFDEMAVRADADAIEMNLLEIEKLAVSPNSRVLITSRIEYFTSAEEEERSLRPKAGIVEPRSAQYHALKLVTWSTAQVDQFIKKRAPLINGALQPWTHYRDSIRRIPGLSDLSCRPVLLEMIVKSMPDLLASGQPVNRANLYETYLHGEIKRQRILKKRELLLSEDERFGLLQQVALDVYAGIIPAITFTEGLNRIRSKIDPPKGEADAYTREFLTCSFLIRRGDEFRFSHNSIMDYLVARGLTREIGFGEPRLFGHRQLPTLVAGFVSEINRSEKSEETLRQWLLSTRLGYPQQPPHLGGNAATLLCLRDKSALAGTDISGTNLTGASLVSANLIGTEMRGAIILDAALMDAKFLLREIKKAKVFNVKILIYVLCEAGRLSAHALIKALDSVDGVDCILVSRTALRKEILWGVAIRVFSLSVLELARAAAAALPGAEGVFIDSEDLDRSEVTVPEELRRDLVTWYWGPAGREESGAR